MKKTFLFLALLFTAGLQAQNSVQYKILSDDPKSACNFAMGIEMAQLDFGMKNLEGLSFSTGVWGFADYKDRIGVDYIFRYGYLTLARVTDKNLKAHRQIEVGAYLSLSKRTVTTTNRVVLSAGKTDNQNGTTTEITTYVMVPSTQYRKAGVRAGLMDYGGCLGMVKTGDLDVDLTLPDIINYNVFGIYAGIFREKYRSLLITTDTYGKKGISLHSRFYVDALILPLSTVKYMDTDYKDRFKHVPLGARMGVAWYPVLTHKEAKTDFKGRRILFQTEVGFRPYDGLFLTGTISIPISRHIGKFSENGAAPKKDVETE